MWWSNIFVKYRSHAGLCELQNTGSMFSGMGRRTVLLRGHQDTANISVKHVVVIITCIHTLTSHAFTHWRTAWCSTKLTMTKYHVNVKLLPRYRITLSFITRHGFSAAFLTPKGTRKFFIFQMTLLSYINLKWSKRKSIRCMSIRWSW